MNASYRHKICILTCIGLCLVVVASLVFVVCSDDSSAEYGDIIVVDDLKYRVLSDYNGSFTVSVAGPCVENPQGALVIPSTVNYNDITYSVTQIDDKAFYKIAGYTGDIVIPTSVVKIGYFAFGYMQGPSGTIYIPSKTSIIDKMAFCGCSGTDFSVHESNPSYLSKNGLLYTKDLTKLIACPTDHSGMVSLPETLEEIGDYAFYGSSKLNGISFPSSLRVIGYYSFGNSGIEEIRFNDGLKTIKDGAFVLCSNLKGELTLPSSIEAIGGSAFGRCSSLTSVVFPSNLNKLGENAFFNCTGLKGEIHLQSDLTEIPKGLFYCCTGITSIILGEGIKTVNLDAFSMCTSLTKISFPESLETVIASDSCNLRIDDGSGLVDTTSASDIRGTTFSGSYAHYIREGDSVSNENAKSNDLSAIIFAIVCGILVCMVIILFIRGTGRNN